MKTKSSSIIFRRNLIATVIVGLLCIIGIRFFTFQILLHNRYLAYAENNSIRSVRLHAPRGYILDRHGDFIVSNRLQYSLAVIPAEVRNSIEKLIGLEKYLNIPGELIRNTISDANGIYERYQPIILHDDVSYIQRSKIEEHRLEFPGIFFVSNATRHYPSRARATHVLGYLRDVAQDADFDFLAAGYQPGDLVGSVGLELQLETILRGEDGYRYHLVDNLLRDLGDIENKPTQYPISGDTVWLSIDIDLQAELELMMEGINGSLIAMDPYTGEILGMVSSPDYVLAPFIGPIPVTLWEQWRDGPNKVLLNRTINGLYPPGSTYKLISAAAILASPNIDPDATIICNGAYQYGNRVFHCNIWSGHGEVNLEDALRESCNIYFYMKIQDIGFANWSAMSIAFGFGSPTGVELPNESQGLVPTREYMDSRYGKSGWTPGHMLNLTLGQGDLLVTPLQVARMTAAIANGGNLVIPKLVKSPRLVSPPAPKISLDPKVWKHLQRAMYSAVNGTRGTGFRARGPGGRVHGKTGSAQNSQGEAHSWFSGYVEIPSGPSLVVTVLVEQGGLGSRIAAPIAGQVFQKFIELYHQDMEAELATVN